MQKCKITVAKRCFNEELAKDYAVPLLQGGRHVHHRLLQARKFLRGRMAGNPVLCIRLVHGVRPDLLGLGEPSGHRCQLLQ